MAGGARVGAVANALLNQDYNSTADMMTRVYDENMEISNPGVLPEFRSTPYEFTVTFRKAPYTPERLRQLGLSDRQARAVQFVRERGGIPMPSTAT